ncbi:MAG: DUF427 domain-containing protein [Pseudomonadota bacterium]
MAKAEWNGVVIAESDVYELVEGNVYFPLASVKSDVLEKTDHTTHCPWKGDASYFTIVVDGARNENAAWIYSAPFEKAAQIKDHIAFWKGVSVTR